jgi:hypothetical protein
MAGVGTTGAAAPGATTMFPGGAPASGVPMAPLANTLAPTNPATPLGASPTPASPLALPPGMPATASPTIPARITNMPANYLRLGSIPTASVAMSPTTPGSSAAPALGSPTASPYVAPRYGYFAPQYGYFTPQYGYFAPQYQSSNATATGTAAPASGTTPLATGTPYATSPYPPSFTSALSRVYGSRGY